MYRLHYAPDNASLIVRLALEEIGAPYETVLVDRSTRAQKTVAYRKLNPFGLIPVLETPEGPVFETAAILLWLADTHGALAPPPSPARNGDGRGAFLSWLFAMSNGLHTDLRQLFYPALYCDGAPQGHRNLTIARIKEHLQRLDALAAKGPAWFAGESPSVLDLYMVVMLRWMALYPVDGTQWFDLGAWPHLAALAHRMEQRPSCHAAQDAEGLGPRPFSSPRYATPRKGSAT